MPLNTTLCKVLVLSVDVKSLKFCSTRAHVDSSAPWRSTAEATSAMSKSSSPKTSRTQRNATTRLRSGSDGSSSPLAIHDAILCRGSHPFAIIERHSKHAFRTLGSVTFGSGSESILSNFKPLPLRLPHEPSATPCLFANHKSLFKQSLSKALCFLRISLLSCFSTLRSALIF